MRARLGLTQAQFAEQVRMTRNSVARMERGEMIVTPPMELLISFVAREAGVEIANRRSSRRATPAKKSANRGKARNSIRKSGRR